MMTINNLNGSKKFAELGGPRRTRFLSEVRKSPGQNPEHHDNNTNGTDNHNQGHFTAGKATPFWINRYDGQQDEQQRADQHYHVGFSRRHEMQDNGRGDAGGDGNECAPPPVRKNAKGEYRQPGQQSNFHSNQSQCLTAGSGRHPHCCAHRNTKTGARSRRSPKSETSRDEFWKQRSNAGPVGFCRRTCILAQFVLGEKHEIDCCRFCGPLAGAAQPVDSRPDLHH
jgi:hypothetical protein